LGHLGLVGGHDRRTTTPAARTRAAASPALVRSRIRSRSNSARAAKTWKTSLPPGVVVSIASCRLRNPIPCSASPVTVSTRCRSDRPRRSSFQTTRVSPGRSCFSPAHHPGGCQRRAAGRCSRSSPGGHGGHHGSRAGGRRGGARAEGVRSDLHRPGRCDGWSWPSLSTASVMALATSSLSGLS
jgi:hypothetical protein